MRSNYCLILSLAGKPEGPARWIVNVGSFTIQSRYAKVGYHVKAGVFLTQQRISHSLEEPFFIITCTDPSIPKQSEEDMPDVSVLGWIDADCGLTIVVDCALTIGVALFSFSCILWVPGELCDHAHRKYDSLSFS